jgi:DNA-binding MarR family transcriptional regulator
MKKENYSKIIDQIEKIRSKNNVNWMDILRLVFKLDPKNASKIMKKINYDDKRISALLKKLSNK